MTQGNDISAAILAVDRAIGDVRRGGAVVLRGAGGEAALVVSPEFLTDATRVLFERTADTMPTLVLTQKRAKALGVPYGQASAVALPLAKDWNADHVRALAEPVAPRPADPGHGLPTPCVAHALDVAAISLMKRANLLPAALTRRLSDNIAHDAAHWAVVNNLLLVDLDQIHAYAHLAASRLHRVSAARVPLADAPDAEVVAFRPADGGSEHLAILIGTPRPGAPTLVRLHSQCFTGDILGSLRCDCGDQLRGAVRDMAAAGAGVVLYLAQEGRGIGLVNKLRAYQLQDQGLDTFEANEQLGFDADERHYHVAAAMLLQLGFATIRLMTNNPAKIAALAKAGIDVVERVAHAFPANPHNDRYLATKAGRGGHML